MFKILAVILKSKKYIIIVITSTVVIGAVSYYLTVINIYQKSIVAYADMNGILFTASSLVLSAAIALLVGFYIALATFRKDIVKARAVGNKAAGVSGVATGIIASGCPSCGVPLLGAIGFPLALYSLPFKGLEIKILSIFFLFLAIFFISKNIMKNLASQCSIDIPSVKLADSTSL